MMQHSAETAIRASSVGIHDCWNRIGVHGDKSCPELPKHSHCRNCPAYSAAAAMLLDHPILERSAPDWANHVAKAKPGEQDETESAIIFRLGAEWFALPTLILNEVVGLRAIHSLPHRRGPLLLGLANVRGELVICASLARLLGGEAIVPTQGRLMVAHDESGRVAFPVDEVQQNHRYQRHELRPVPTTVARSASSFTKGLLPWRDRMVGCLDERLVLQALNRGLA